MLIKKFKNLIFLRNKYYRWFFVGGVFALINSLLLYLLIDLSSLSIPVGTALAAEFCTLLRYFINEYWVFKHGKASIKGCIHFHVVNMLSWASWWLVVNFLVVYGIHYQLSSILALGVSTCVSLFTNFYWIWSEKKSLKYFNSK